jgi:hypothetical protein
MLPRLRLLLMLAALLAAAAAPARAQDRAAKEAAAEEAARAWLALIDAGRYRASWDQSARLMQVAVPPEQWASTVGNTRAQLDSLRSRALLAARWTDEPPRQAPPGEYVFLQYRTRFGEETWTETVVMRREEAAWKSAGYFMRPTGG